MAGGGGGKFGNTAGGGISPDQMAYAQFVGNEQKLKNANTFGSAGTGASTMHTMADAGAGNETALLAQQMSQADANAMQNFNNQQKASTAQGIGGLGTALGATV
jgi:hypothetical protein